MLFHFCFQHELPSILYPTKKHRPMTLIRQSCFSMLLLALGLGAASAEEPRPANRPPDSEWELNLPGNPVSRRLSRNFDFHGPKPEVLGELQGPGCIRRIWVTGKNIGREVILRIYFDGETVPYVEAPLADFFGVMHNMANPGEPYVINTPFLDVKPKNGFTSFFPMPFARSARVELVGGEKKTSLYYMIDWHEYPGSELREPMRFCARWRREAPVRDYQDDFLMLDADGPGRLVGFTYGVDMLQVDDGEAVNLGNQPYLRAKTLEVPLVAGRNSVTVRLGNKVGLTRGAWNFSFRCVTAGGQVLLPRAK